MDVLKVSGLLLIGLVGIMLFKAHRPEWGGFVRVGVMLLSVGFLLSMVFKVLSFAKELSRGFEMGLSHEMWQILIKALGITWVTDITASVCKDCGEGGMAQWIETAGRLEILVLSLPLIADLLSLAQTLLQMD